MKLRSDEPIAVGVAWVLAGPDQFPRIGRFIHSVHLERLFIRVVSNLPL
jgi:hypothetical protein